MKRIEHYRFGSIKVDGRTYKSDLIIYPNKVQPDWWRKEGHKLHLEDIPDVLVDAPEVLVVGKGDPGKMLVDAQVEQELAERNIQLVAVPTKMACDRFNELSQEGKRAVAALHLTC